MRFKFGDIPDKKKLIMIAITLITTISMVVVIVNLDNWFSGSWSGDRGDGANTVYIDGVAYEPKRMTNYLIIGVDEFGEAESTGTYSNTKQADLLLLLSFDHTAKTYSLLHINRDTMTDVTRLSVTGENAGTGVMQIALAHTYGDGMELSGLNTKNTVSKMLYDIPIDYFITMTMDAVAALNDYVGGVTVTLQQDTLQGDDALLFVRARGSLADSSNLARMERQKQYMDAFLQTVSQKELDGDLGAEMYETVQQYTVSNASVQTIRGVFDSLKDYTYHKTVSPAGEARVGTLYMEFYVDAESLKSIMKELYLVKIEPNTK